MTTIPRLPDLYIPPSVSVSRGSVSRPSATELEKLAKQQIDVRWSQTCFNKTFRLVYGIQPVPGWYMTRPVINGSGNLVVAVYWCCGPIEGIDKLTINGADVPAGVIVTTYLGNQSGVVDPTLAAALSGSGFADTYDGVVYTVFEIPTGTVSGFPSQAQFSALVRGIVLEENPAPQARYWRVWPLDVESVSDRPGVSELQFRATPGGSNVATGGTALSGGGGFPANAFDGNPGTEWNATGEIGTAWIGYDVGAGNTIAVNEVYMRAYSTASRTPSSFRLEYSDDGSTWVELMTKSATHPWAASSFMVFTNTGLTSENPGQHLEHFVTNAEYGLTATISGAAEVISFCNDLVGDEIETRCLAGFTIHSARERQVLDMLSEHAECLWSYEGLGVFVVPDTAVESPVATLTVDQIEERSLKPRGKGLVDSPSTISLTYTERTSGSLQWTQDSVTVTGGAENDVNSVVMMPGVYRRSEGRRKATKRIRRLAAAASFPWIHLDEGIAFQVGDVVRLPNIRGLVDQDVRILAIDQASAGRYPIEAEPYSSSYYDGALPVPTVDVPVGGILPYFSDDSIPDGWTLYSDGDGLPIRGDNTNAGTDTGVTDIPQLSGTTSTVGNHAGPEFNGPGRIDEDDEEINTRTKKAEGAHSHDYETDGPVEHTMLQVRRRLIKKTGSDGPLPQNAAVFANGQLMSGEMSPLNTHIGRKMAAGATSEQVGDSNTRSIAVTAISDAGAHVGHEGAGFGKYVTGAMFGPPVFNNVSAPNHNHGGEGSISVTVNPKARKMAVYVASVETGISLGAVIGFDPALSLPAGWAEFDLAGHLIEISTPQSAGTDSGNDTVSWTGTTTPDGKHSHKGSQIAAGGQGAYAKYHEMNTDHTHSMTGSAAFKPLAHCLRLIQYTGV